MKNDELDNALQSIHWYIECKYGEAFKRIERSTELAKMRLGIRPPMFGGRLVDGLLFI